MGFETNETYQKLSKDYDKMKQEVTKVGSNTGWFKPGFDFTKVVMDKPRTYNINGQQVKVTGEFGEFNGYQQYKYEFTFPDGRTMTKVTNQGLNHRNNYDFLNSVVRSTFSPEHQALNIGMNPGGRDENIKKLAEHRNINPDTFVANDAGGLVTPEREAELKAIGEAGQAKLQEQTGLVHTDTYADTQKKEATLSSSNQFLSDSSQTGDTGTNKMASGVLVRNKEDGKVYFVDGDKKLRYVTDPAFIKGAGVIDVDGSHFQGIEKGANITTKPPFDFKNATEAKALMAETGIQWEQPRGFDTTTGTTPSGLKIGTPESAEELKNLSISSAGRDNAGETILDIAKGEGLPDEIINSEEFNSLSDDQQSLFLAQWTAMNARNEETRANAQEALEQAQQIADPIARIQIAFALDSIPDQFRISKMSIEDRLTSARENIAEIDRLMGDATMEEQQMLNSLKRDFGINAERIEESMAEAGNTYSSKRSDAERYLAQQNLDIRQSRARSFDQQSRNYEKNKAEIERQAELTREAGEAQLKGIVRDAEATLGTEGAKGLDLKGLSGNKISTLGGKKGVPEVGGSIEEQRRASIINLSKTFGESKDPAQLSSLFNL